VRSAGVSVGQVTSITLDKNTYQGLVVMKINESVQFPVDSSAKILTAGLLGDQYVGIEPGSDDKNLANGDLIKQTQSAVVLENLIGQLIFNKAADMGSSSTPSSAPGASLAPAPPTASAAASGSKK
jgi:phospholipid/cholesterol/gamma-HCH transport system substrate-binding protein